MKIKALSKLKPEEGIWMTEVEKPEMGHNDLLIRIKKETAICGTAYISTTGMSGHKTQSQYQWYWVRIRG